MYYRIRLLSLTRQNKKMAYEMKTDHRSTNSGRKTPAFANYRFACFEFVSTSSKVAEQTDLQVVTTRVKTCEIFAILFPVYACFAYICWKKKKREKRGKRTHESSMFVANRAKSGWKNFHNISLVALSNRELE